MGPTSPARAPGVTQERLEQHAVAPAAVRLHELDGLRGLLALFVVAYHLAGPLQSLRTPMAIWAPILQEGWYAVDVFFVMSGFVMMHVYGNTFATGASWASLTTFMKVRVARLYPVHLAVLVLMFVCVLQFMLQTPALAADGGRYSVRALLASLFMLHSPWIDHRSWNYPAWSISAEWHAYLLFPLLVPLVRKLRKGAALAWLAAAVLIPLALYLQHLKPDPFPTNGVVVLARVLPLFTGGMALHVLHARGTLMSRPLALLATLGTIACLWLSATAPYAVLLTPLLVLAVLEDATVRDIFRAPLLLWLGKVSYSLYMTHALVEIFFMRMAAKLLNQRVGLGVLDHPGAALVLWLLSIAAALVLGWLTWRWVEGPGRRLVMRLLPERAAKVAVAPGARP